MMATAMVSQSSLALVRTKIRAAAIHLSLSAMIIALYLGMVFFVWYPYPYFLIEKVWDVIRIVGSVDLVLGPLLTFVVFRPGKKSLRFDLGVIVTVQLAALLWGVHVTYNQRPLYVAIFDNIFSIVAASEVDTGKIRNAGLTHTVWSGPQLVYVDLPFEDPGFLEQARQEVEKGMKLSARSEFYTPFLPHKDQVFQRSINIQQRMSEFPELRRDIGELVKKHGGVIDDYVFMSVEGRQALGFLVFRRATGEVVDAMVE